MTQEEMMYLELKQDILQFSIDLAKGITHYMSLFRIIIVFLVMLPLNVAFFVFTHLMVLMVLVFKDTALLFIKCYLDFQREARGTSL